MSTRGAKRERCRCVGAFICDACCRKALRAGPANHDARLLLWCAQNHQQPSPNCPLCQEKKP